MYKSRHNMKAEMLSTGIAFALTLAANERLLYYYIATYRKNKMHALSLLPSSLRAYASYIIYSMY